MRPYVFLIKSMIKMFGDYVLENRRKGVENEGSHMAVHRGSLFFSSLMMPRVGEWKGVWKGAGSIRILKKIRKSRLTNGTALANWGSWSHAPHQHKGLCFSLTHCSSLSVRIHNSVQLFSLPLPSCLSSLLGNKCKA